MGFEIKSVPSGPLYGSRPANVVAAVDYYETIGLPGQFLVIGNVVAGEAIAGFQNYNVTNWFKGKPNEGFAHVATYASRVQIRLARAIKWRL